MNGALQGLVVAVVGEWFASARSPREAMAANPEIRRLPAPARAEVARVAAQVIAQQRWLAFVIGEDVVPSSPPRRRAEQLVAVHLRLAGDAVLDAGARSRCAVIADPIRRLATRRSLPDWLAAEFTGCHGDRADGLLQALNESASRTVRANLLRVPSREHLAARLRSLGIATEPARHAPWALHVRGEQDLFDTAAYREGAFEQQDEASQLAALAVAPPPRGKVLDLCAGSGGKTLALAAQLANLGQVFATDVSARRLDALRTRLVRAGADNVQVRVLPGGELPVEIAHFAARADRILVDAPCSGTGSWRRRPEARWSIDHDGFVALQRTQDQLLDLAAAHLQPGARLVYATCSVLRDENEARVEALRQRHRQLELVRLAEVLGGERAAPIADATGTFLQLLPDRHGCDGFFAAILRRSRSTAAQGNT